MASLNKVQIIGNLGADPDVRYTPAGDATCTISVATTDRWKDKASGEMKEVVNWHRVVFWRRLAEIAGEYLSKGSQVYIEGKLQNRKYEKNGEDRYITEIRGEVMQMLGSRQGGDGESRPARRAPPAEGSPKKPATTGTGFDDMDDDSIPF